MANGVHGYERVPENLRKQFVVAVRSIKWSYAIFWSLSTTQQGLPGRALANGKSIWLCNAQYADSKVFFRSLLAMIELVILFLGPIIRQKTPLCLKLSMMGLLKFRVGIS